MCHLIILEFVYELLPKKSQFSLTSSLSEISRENHGFISQSEPQNCNDFGHLEASENHKIIFW